MNPRVTKVSTSEDYTLNLLFSNGETGRYSCFNILDFGVFKELRDIKYFEKARVLDGTVVWPNEQDICPDTLYLNSVKAHV
jgi:hypothetical protein